MRWLGVDPGGARIGLAACDAEERVAVPLEVVAASAALPAIRAVVAREGIEGIVVGLPLHMDGREGGAAEAARRLGERVRRALNLPVEYEDERLTSWAAGPARGRPNDDVAAALILQAFLDRRRQETSDRTP